LDRLPGEIFFEKIFLPSCRAPQNAPNKRARFLLKFLFLKICAKETQKTVKMTPTFEKINFLTPLKDFFQKKTNVTLERYPYKGTTRSVAFRLFIKKYADFTINHKKIPIIQKSGEKNSYY